MDGYSFAYCLYPLWNNSHSKNCILVVKQITWFYSIQCYKQNKTIPPKKRKLFIWILALSCNGCDARCEAPVIWWGWNLAISFLEKINLFFFNIFHICVFLFCGCICTISICVTDNQHAYSEWQLSVWMLIGHYGLHAHICMIMICITAHQRVILW